MKCGDAVQREMHILFADIREFTKRSERFSPEENFAFMHAYHRAMEPAIHGASGFVNEYLGDGLMALFPRTPGDAVRAAIDMFKALDRLNSSVSSPDEKTRIGIGVNTGRLMLGAFGGERMNAGVVGDAVNLASRIEALTKRYGLGLLVSEHTVNHPKAQGVFTARLVDRVRV